jgi:type II secretory pathway component PulJ
MKRRTAGFMLVNMLIVIALMGAFAVVADRVFRLSLQTSSKVAREQEESIRLEQAINTLRADVWGARTLETAGTSGLRITDGGGRAVRWETQNDGEVVRSQGEDPPQRWSELRLEFLRDGQWLSVRRSGVEVALLGGRK